MGRLLLAATGLQALACATPPPEPEPPNLVVPADDTHVERPERPVVPAGLVMKAADCEARPRLVVRTSYHAARLRLVTLAPRERTEWTPWEHSTRTPSRAHVSRVDSPPDDSGRGMELLTLAGLDQSLKARVVEGAVTVDTVSIPGSAYPPPALLLVHATAPGRVAYALELTGGGLMEPLRVEGALDAEARE